MCTKVSCALVQELTKLLTVILLPLIWEAEKTALIRKGDKHVPRLRNHHQSHIGIWLKKRDNLSAANIAAIPQQAGNRLHFTQLSS